MQLWFCCYVRLYVVLFNFELDNIQVEENVGFFNVCVIKTGTRNTETSVLIAPSDTDMDFSGFMADGTSYFHIETYVHSLPTKLTRN